MIRSHTPLFKHSVSALTNTLDSEGGLTLELFGALSRTRVQSFFPLTAHFTWAGVKAHLNSGAHQREQNLGSPKTWIFQRTKEEARVFQDSRIESECFCSWLIDQPQFLLPKSKAAVVTVWHCPSSMVHLQSWSVKNIIQSK